MLVFSFGAESSGIGRRWRAKAERPGVNLLPNLSASTVRNIADQVERVKRAGDIIIASIHWGGNWGYDIRHDQQKFAHALIDIAGIDIIHGHSSHHVKGIEVYKNHSIIYGCGDFLTDYEGISGNEQYHDDFGVDVLPHDGSNEWSLDTPRNDADSSQEFACQLCLTQGCEVAGECAQLGGQATWNSRNIERG